MTTPGGASAVSIERAFETAIDTVWATLTRPEILAAWFREGIAVDVHPTGGIADARGAVGSYVEVEEPRRLRLLWGRPGEAKIDVEFRLEESPGGTRLLLVLGGFSDPSERLRHAEFWHWAVDSLEAFLKTGFGIPYEPWRELQAELHRRAAVKSAEEAEAERRAAGVVLAPLADAPAPSVPKKPAARKKAAKRGTKRRASGKRVSAGKRTPKKSVPRRRKRR